MSQRGHVHDPARGCAYEVVIGPEELLYCLARLFSPGCRSDSTNESLGRSQASSEAQSARLRIAHGTNREKAAAANPELPGVHSSHPSIQRQPREPSPPVTDIVSSKSRLWVHRNVDGRAVVTGKDISATPELVEIWGGRITAFNVCTYVFSTQNNTERC